MHVAYAHPSLASGLNMKDYETVLYDRHSVQRCRGKSDSSSDADRLGGTASYYWIYPNLMLNRYGRWLDTNRVVPLAVDRCAVVFDYWLERDSNGNVPPLSDPLIQEQLQTSHRIQLEDEELCARVQQGIQSDSYDVGRYAPTVEQGMHHFHRLLLQDLQKGE